jgi:hypothetical protein
MIINKAHLMITITMDIINYNKKNNLTGWVFFFEKNNKFVKLFQEISKNQKVFCDFVVNVGSDHNIYLLDYKIINKIPNNFINKY